MIQYKNIKRRMTLEEVGREMGLTAERVRQIENEALAKIRKALSEKARPVVASDVIPDNFTWIRA